MDWGWKPNYLVSVAGQRISRKEPGHFSRSGQPRLRDADFGIGFAPPGTNRHSPVVRRQGIPSSDAMATTDYRDYLKPEVVSRLSSLELRARMVVEGFITGLHKSPYHGFSVEFAEHRQYMPGDEIRRIDWKVFGNTNRYYIKQYEEETNLKAWVILDQSASMAFHSPGRVSKFDYAVSLAAALTLLMLRQQDAVGAAIYDTEPRGILPPRSRSSYLQEVLRLFTSAQPAKGTGTARSLNILAER